MANAMLDLYKFQFHMVRLKDIKEVEKEERKLFQFHMVRLKVILFIASYKLTVSFNSTWYD